MTGFLDQLLSMPAWLVLLVVFALPALESSAFLGFLFPGETAVLLGGVAASRGEVPLAAVMAVGIGGAILGDAVGYLVGRRWGRRILASSVGRVVDARHLERAERLLRRRGVGAVFLGRFTATLRVMIPGLAGMAGVSPRRFFVANVAGGVAWGALVAVAGYLAGNNWQTVEHYLTRAGLALTVGVLAAFVVARLVRRVFRGRRELSDAAPRRRTRGGGTRAGRRRMPTLLHLVPARVTRP
jgi:membrane protein DedA with SNARE-associated domain